MYFGPGEDLGNKMRAQNEEVNQLIKLLRNQYL